MKRNRRAAGFSLIEVMIVAFILVFVSAALYMILVSASNTYGNVTSLGDTQERARRVMDEISKELRMANQTATLVTTTYGTNDTITFKVPIVDATTGKAVLDGSNNVTWTTDIKYQFQYSTDTGTKTGNLLVDANNNRVVDEGRIVRIQNGKTQKLCDFVKEGGLVFTQTGDNVVITMTLISVDHKNKVIETTLKTSITLRNST